MAAHDPSSQSTGSYLRRSDAGQRASEGQELSEGMKAPPIKRSEWMRKLVGLVGGVLAALLVYFLMPADLEIWPSVTAATAVFVAFWLITEAIPIPATALLPLIIRSEERRV